MARAVKRTDAITLSLAAAILYLPLLVLVVFSFNASPLMAFPLTGFSFRWYAALAGNAAFLHGLLTSFLVAQPVGLLAMLVGLAAALALTAPRLPWRVAFLALVLLPFLVPKSVLAIAQAMLLSRIGWDRGAVTLILAQALVAAPFATALVTAVLLRFDHRLTEAARDLGATPWESFRFVMLPHLKGALGGAYSVGVILSLADLTIATFLSGRTQPLSLIVASEFRRELRPDLNAMQVVVLALTAVVIGTGQLVRLLRRRPPVSTPLAKETADLRADFGASPGTLTRADSR